MLKCAAAGDVKPGVAKTFDADEIGSEAVMVHVGDELHVVAMVARRFPQQRAVFRDQAMAAEHNVGSRFPDSARGVNVSGHTPA